ncbi:uncharacterized protein PgNI_12167 [Pyricularia grisea]|uniref:Uncharacterized protein n=1 Tax=Pyricularia grisea TaxID=148305 RepID=A0A6P8AQS6_PYRGI|nr:uncharacterized protein PgNI_12167 [Pyricularia grisea]TLD04420.1 hypothetical protein PgNI_12167 [Pyricularia grisea]
MGAFSYKFIPSSFSRRLGLATNIKPFERLCESLPKPKTAIGSRGYIDEQKPKKTATLTDWKPSTAAASTADLPIEPLKSGRSTVDYFPTDARNNINYNNGFLIRSVKRNPISLLEPIPEVTFAPLPSVNTILRPVLSATIAKSTLSVLSETFPTAINIISPIFKNINPFPAFRRAISDLIPERPAYLYDPLFDNYAPKQPFHIQ